MYVDVTRSEMIMSQISEDKVAKEETQTINSTGTHTAEINSRFKIAIPFLSEGGLFAKAASTKSNAATTSIRYDLNWTNTNKLVDFLEQSALKNEEFELKISSTIHAVGRLSIYDLSILRNVATDSDLVAQFRLEFPRLYKSFERWVERGRSRIEPPRNSGKGDGTNQQALVKMGIEGLIAFFRQMPFQMVCTITQRDGTEFWFTLKDEFMISGYRDVSLKHGSDIPGIWSVVGFVDDFDAVDGSGIRETYEFVASGSQKNMYSGLGKVLGHIRSLAGRPAGTSALTLIAIYRNIGI